MSDAAWTAIGAIAAAIAALLSAVLVEQIRSRSRVQQIRKDSQKTLKELTPNHGTSLRDVLDKLCRTVDQMALDAAAGRADDRRRDAELDALRALIKALHPERKD